MNVSGFNHLTLRVRDLEQSLRFYCGLLGMKLVHKGRKDVYLEWGNAWICLLERPDDGSIAAGPGMDHVAFSIREPDFFRAVSLLKEHRVEMVREPVYRGGGWSVQFKDPDGIVLELFTGNLEKRMIHWTA
ncbi:VOC family protein [Thermoactinomyces intermedius]|jgi:catechol 2,3-dioxygenase-like lactoylglutathione lyase family enzyme|uniref:VOC family protein n=1 Tax=Thermoactinomyces intermedius TaxID=2024 RepID=A0A8I1AEF1_THEIN|nr:MULTISPECIES: VOC family protein [Thermoactinomyces]MBA4549175.1 VOC family protein [Thermoactinomyces intermedius]MBA4837408.1 VOC family protein [Thermoactinomyces intermedius]MBH8595809.1 VOC family protein [Thermoactinomyces intermedius]MBH8600779.1 VOC family protein [Thermoactinomyces sp. CICC 23799]